MFVNLISRLFRRINRWREWYELPFILSVINLGLLRVHYRENNLFDTERNRRETDDQGNLDVRRNRTLDGSHNDLKKPTMGSAGTRFGRNVPINETFGETGDGLLTPSPREISRKLLTRTTFQPASTLNLLAAGWLQFMVHDWFSHGKNERDNPIRIPLEDDDDWHERDGMTIRRTQRDQQTVPGDEGQPATYRNTETQWWDGSQIYGSKPTRADLIRSGGGTDPAPDGKIFLDDQGRLPLDDKTKVELAGVNGNWWIGLSVLHTVFAREHNAIVDDLQAHYPKRRGDSEWLFHKARMINAALLAKIHTVEWTPALLNTPELRTAMRGQWWGLLDEWFTNAHGRVGESEVFSGIIGSPQDHHSASYAITEEFAAVYRMHSLIPDDFSFRKLVDNAPLGDPQTLPEVSGRKVQDLYKMIETHDGNFNDILYSLGTENPGALTLHNFPKHLQTLQKQPGSESQWKPGDPDRVVDLGAIDILRDRERGVPRYCQFRRLIGMKAPRDFYELRQMVTEPAWADQLERIYGDVEKIDLLIGTLAERVPPGFAFGDTAFRIFILMASRRLKSDRFYTDDYTPEVYTEAGLTWIRDNGMASVLSRHCPALAPKLGAVRNAFFPWPLS
ncbi:MAG: peroxidase family protein [Geminicoccaceae bacterium]